MNYYEVIILGHCHKWTTKLLGYSLSSIENCLSFCSICVKIRNLNWYNNTLGFMEKYIYWF